MTLGLFILFFLPLQDPGAAAPITCDSFYPRSLAMELAAPELLDDFDTDPDNPKDDWFGMDKFWHWALAFTLTGSSYHFVHNQLHSPDPDATIITVSSVLVFSVVKEFYDLKRYGLFSFKDLVYDSLGIATGYGVFIVDWGL
jgi:uncharacterized protein YfiM (DUF2279 family)